MTLASSAKPRDFRSVRDPCDHCRGMTQCRVVRSATLLVSGKVGSSSTAGGYGTGVGLTVVAHQHVRMGKF
ncbi:hypothetical protein [Methylomicrobium sp. Wu6]|uniref:hypothetical protein n=1 Tax=Methylomicrobium sp. Wu6 TaxID=3107928 RepID=UPI002DD64821|nr:hypothetical protein [Methylomicrobium sp. Wu6]MEC4747548.1 hypothetical protein [Methylomicrobium sp. Wu6]